MEGSDLLWKEIQEQTLEPSHTLRASSLEEKSLQESMAKKWKKKYEEKFPAKVEVELKAYAQARQ